MRLLIAPITALLAISGTANAAKKVASVIGKDAYLSVPKLDEAHGDGTAMSQVLTENASEVVTAFDAARREMSASVAKIFALLTPSRTGTKTFASSSSNSMGDRAMGTMTVNANKISGRSTYASGLRETFTGTIAPDGRSYSGSSSLRYGLLSRRSPMGMEVETIF